MRLPIKNKQPAQTLSLPDLSGGLNLRDGMSEILDNQLTDCKNVWYKDGLLKTRPGIISTQKGSLAIPKSEGFAFDIKNYPNINHEFDGEKHFLQSAKLYSELSDWRQINFTWVGKSDCKEIGGISYDSADTSFFVCIQKDMLYCFLSTKKAYKYDIEKDEGWEEIKESEFYVPKVLIQCEAMSNKKNVTKEQVLASGVMNEGFNILSDYYQMSFNSYNPMIVTEEKPKHDMRYHLVENVTKKHSGMKVTAVYTRDGKIYTHTVNITETSSTWTEEKEPGDGLIMKVWKNNVSFWKDEDNVATVGEDDDYEIVITAPYISSKEDKSKIFNMTQSVWFGGGNAGFKGGTRLFLCGNSTEPSLVVWSDLNNPLYFPENSYFYVGDSSSKVTGFGKQSDLLVIFKKDETWCTSYQQNTSVTAESLTNQSMIDLTTSVYFPLMQIHSTIGCAHPDSVQMCRNRLVWLGNDNKVYTLVSESVYNERSIFCVSEMVDRKLNELSTDKVSSCDWNGYYCLCFGKDMYLMDYNCYGFTHVASYSKTEDANKNIPWYYWELPADGTIVALNESVIFSQEHSANEMFSIRYNLLNYKNISVDKLSNPNNISFIEDYSILSMITTKIFDFGLSSIRKNVEQINLQLGNNDGKEIKIALITENGTEETEIIPMGDVNDQYNAAYIDSRAIFPCIKQVIRFGIKMECMGVLAVDSAIIKFRTTGGTR